ncbi:MAG: NADP-dependent phosphogluconate dehydrogenase [Candidatus Saccharimonadales bacterium]
MKAAIVGLGKMGMQISERWVRAGNEVIAYDRRPEVVQSAVQHGAKSASSRQNVVEQFGDDKAVIWLMIPAGAVAAELNEWLKVLRPGDIVLDGGNSDFRDTVKHAKLAGSKKVDLVDVGTSGGVLGVENGFSMMAGGEQKAFATVEPLLQALAKPYGGYHYFGKSGAGHFVKMVHNGIEYGIMESLAEGYSVLKKGPYKDLDLAAAAQVWQQSSIIQSNLNELIGEELKVNPNLTGIKGYVAENGEARWTLQVAKELGLELPSIQAALDIRVGSQHGQTSFATKLLAAMRNRFGGHNLNKNG